MKQNSKIIPQTLPNTKPVLSLKTMRLIRGKLKRQIYLFSILATGKYFELERELESFISDRSFLDLDLNNAMKLLVELIQLKQQTESVISQYNFFHNPLIQRGAK